MVNFFKALWAIIEEWFNPPVYTPPKLHVEPIVVPEPVVVPKYLWGTPKEARHSTRVICDESGLSLEDKNIICAVIMAESEFKIKAVGRPNRNGSRDWGIVQMNDALWIGEGKYFKSTDEVLNNPEKSVRFIIDCYKKGKIIWWMGYTSGNYKKFL